MSIGIRLAFLIAAIIGQFGTQAHAQTSPADQAREAALAAGRDTFRQFCAPCHGADATGRGPVAPVLTVAPADLTRLSVRYRGQFPLEAVTEMLTASERASAPPSRAGRIMTVAHGSDQMPIWGPVFVSIDRSRALAAARVANLVAYLESIQR